MISANDVPNLEFTKVEEWLQCYRSTYCLQVSYGRTDEALHKNRKQFWILEKTMILKNSNPAPPPCNSREKLFASTLQKSKNFVLVDVTRMRFFFNLQLWFQAHDWRQSKIFSNLTPEWPFGRHCRRSRAENHGQRKTVKNMGAFWGTTIRLDPK